MHPLWPGALAFLGLVAMTLATFYASRREGRASEERISQRMAHAALHTQALMRDSARETRQIIREEAERFRYYDVISKRRTERLLKAMDLRHRDTDTLIRMLLERTDKDRPTGQPG